VKLFVQFSSCQLAATEIRKEIKWNENEMSKLIANLVEKQMR
jgi:hypothetical protein